MGDNAADAWGARRRPRRIVDCHQHVGQLAVGMAGEGAAAVGVAAADEHVAALDRFGFDAACILPGLQYERPYGIHSTRLLNDDMARYRDARRDRFPIALGTVEPLHGLELCREEMVRVRQELGLDGLTWHTRYQGVAVSDRRMHRLLDMAAELQLPCFIHMFSESTMESPWMFAEIAEQHPETTIVVLDGFSSHTQCQYVMDLARRFEDLYFDTAICFPLLRPLERFVRDLGSERLVFGTDSYASPSSYSSPSVLHELVASDIDDEAMEDIMWRNLARIFPRAGGEDTAADGPQGARDLREGACWE